MRKERKGDAVGQAVQLEALTRSTGILGRPAAAPITLAAAGPRRVGTATITSKEGFMPAPMSPRTSRYVAHSLARSVVTALAVVSLFGPLAALAHAPGITERVSVASDGAEGNDASPWFSP